MTATLTTVTPRLDILGSAIADASRARMLCEMMDGRAWTNKELAGAAGITPQTATAHLQRLRDAGLIVAGKSGRCVYHRIAGPDVAAALETLSGLAPADNLYRAQQHKGGAARMLVARSCYDHLAGRLGVALADCLTARGDLVTDGDRYRLAVSEVWARLGVTPPPRPAAQPFARACLDWTERRPHVAGPLGTQILTHALAADWVRRSAGQRGLKITRTGLDAFEQILGLPRDGIGQPR